MVCFAKHTLNKHNLGRLGLKPKSDPLSFLFFFSCLFFLGWVRTFFLQQLHRNREKKKTLPSEAEGEGNSAAPAGECSPFPPLFSLSSLCSWFFVFRLSPLFSNFCRLPCFSPLFFSLFFSFVFFLCFFLYIVYPLYVYTLRSVIIVLESLRMWETKFQSNSFFSLKFEFD
jgi:hypothetical protein